METSRTRRLPRFTWRPMLLCSREAEMRRGRASWLRADVTGSKVERRLTAILAADVAGYSRLVAADEEGALAQVASHLREGIQPAVRDPGGQAGKPTRDGRPPGLPHR